MRLNWVDIYKHTTADKINDDDDYCRPVSRYGATALESRKLTHIRLRLLLRKTTLSSTENCRSRGRDGFNGGYKLMSQNSSPDQSSPDTRWSCPGDGPCRMNGWRHVHTLKSYNLSCRYRLSLSVSGLSGSNPQQNNNKQHKEPSVWVKPEDAAVI